MKRTHFYVILNAYRPRVRSVHNPLLKTPLKGKAPNGSAVRCFVFLWLTVGGRMWYTDYIMVTRAIRTSLKEAYFCAFRSFFL